MAKAPVMGAVKTRLAREIGCVAATAFYRHASAAVLGRLGRDPRWHTVISVAAAPGMTLRTTGPTWPQGLPREVQAPGDLGRRMQAIMEGQGAGPVIIIGTDIPGAGARHVAEAFRLLAGHDAVLGPALDGGFWLIGLRRVPRVPAPFAGVRWSSPHALADVLANLAGRRIAYAATLSDVDDRASYQRFGWLAGRRILPVAAPRSEPAQRDKPAPPGRRAIQDRSW
jgi:hypothetical protein